MSATLQLLLALAVLILAAKLAGWVSLRFRQPAVLGQLLAGLLLGPSFIGFFQSGVFDAAASEETVMQLAELGVIFLMFLAGLEVDLQEMLARGRVAVLAGLFGVIMPLLMGGALAALFGYPAAQSAFIGLTLTATSVSISAQVLLELGVLRSREGLALLGAAVVDDVVVILLLSFFVATSSTGGTGGGEMILVVVRMILFGALAAAVGMLLPNLTARVKRLPITEGMLAWVIVVTLLYAWAAEAVGQLAAITGAFLAGIFLGRGSHRQEIHNSMHTLAYGFFVPLFLVSIGLNADVRQLQGSAIGFLILFLLVAVLSKLSGSGLGARLAGMPWPQALRVGAGMISRGEVGLIVASVGLDRGLIGKEMFSVVVVMVLATTLVTPMLLRRLFSSREVGHAGEPARISDG